MISRSDSAAMTRKDLLRAATDLLDAGGPAALTLRAVGARAGVSRGAPYGHFPDKEHLITQLVVDGWLGLAETLELIWAKENPASEKLEEALMALLNVARTKPHLYTLMWAAPPGDPEPVLQAASRSQDVFLRIVADVVGPADARQYGALLMSSAHGIAGMDLSGHLSQEKWDTTAQSLVAMLVRSMPGSGRLPGQRT